jgi:hypothetical protein
MQQLGGITFTFNPDRQSIPARKKSVSAVQTYTSNAVFQWTAVWPGSIIILEWEFMPAAQYDDLVDVYLSIDPVTFNPDTGGSTYQVVITDMTGEYFEVAATDLTYRKNVKLTLMVTELN